MPGAVERSLSRLNRPSRRVAGPGKRHSARGTPRAQPRDVRSAGRDTWNLTGEALGGPRKRSWRRCSRARSGRRSAIRGAHSGALDRPNPQIPPRAPRYARAPLTLRLQARTTSCLVQLCITSSVTKMSAHLEKNVIGRYGTCECHFILLGN